MPFRILFFCRVQIFLDSTSNLTILYFNCLEFCVFFSFLRKRNLLSSNLLKILLIRKSIQKVMTKSKVSVRKDETSSFNHHSCEFSSKIHSRFCLFFFSCKKKKNQTANLIILTQILQVLMILRTAVGKVKMENPINGFAKKKSTKTLISRIFFLFFDFFCRNRRRESRKIAKKKKNRDRSTNVRIKKRRMPRFVPQE